MHTHKFLCVCVPYKVILSLPVSKVTRVAPCSHLTGCQKSCPRIPYCEAWSSPLCTHIPLTEANESCARMLLGRKSPVNALSQTQIERLDQKPNYHFTVYFYHTSFY